MHLFQENQILQALIYIQPFLCQRKTGNKKLVSQIMQSAANHIQIKYIHSQLFSNRQSLLKLMLYFIDKTRSSNNSFSCQDHNFQVSEYPNTLYVNQSNMN